MSVKDTLWGLIEKQLSGRIKKFSGRVAPGREALRELLVKNQPLVVFMDEVLKYITKAAGVKVEESTLAAQGIAFIQELTETVSTLEKASLVITLPSSVIEHYDERAEKLFQQLQKISGRIEKIYTPVRENDIVKVIRRRLLHSINEKSAKDVITGFIEYAEKESILPPGVESSEYMKRFAESYPFMPEVVEALYHRWGSFPSFQRTRGVLRLLSLVIHSLQDSNKPYISLADFDLNNHELRQELLKHIDSEYNSIIGADITDKDSGARKVDNSLGSAYKGLNLGTRSATAILCIPSQEELNLEPPQER